MTLLVLAIVIIGLVVASLSFHFIRKAANRPANGELETLARLTRALAYNRQSITRHVAIK